MKTQTLSVLVENKPGVLARISGLFARRGYNIESLAVGPTERPELSRITLQGGAPEGSNGIEQITKQQNKLVEVLKIVELEDSDVRREMVLVKLRADPATRSQIIEIVQLFRGKTVDVQADSLVIEATGSPDKLAALLEMLKPYGIREIVQSGLVAVARGSKSLTDRKPDRLRPIA